MLALALASTFRKRTYRYANLNKYFTFLLQNQFSSNEPNSGTNPVTKYVTFYLKHDQQPRNSLNSEYNPHASRKISQASWQWFKSSRYGLNNSFMLQTQIIAFICPSNVKISFQQMVMALVRPQEPQIVPIRRETVLQDGSLSRFMKMKNGSQHD